LRAGRMTAAVAALAPTKAERGTLTACHLIG